MRCLCSLVIGILMLSNVAEADIIFTVSPLTQKVPSGNDAVFNIFVESDSGAVTIDAIDVNANAGLGDGSAGLFTAGQTFLLGADPFDVLSTPGQAFSTNFQNGGISISTPVLYATLTLSTTGVPLGLHQISLDQLSANSPTLGAISTGGTGASYLVTAVPEPSSLFVGIFGSCALFLRRRLRTSSSPTEFEVAV